MIIYTETNFLLEMAYLQDGCGSCREILSLARQRLVVVVMPAFSLVEARQTWDRRSSEMNVLQTQLQPVIRQLARSEPFRSVTESSRELLTALVASGEETRLRLEEAITEVSSIGNVLPLTADIATHAREAELKLSLSPSDAVVYASVLFHLQSAPKEMKCFLNRDSKGFANPSIYDELEAYNCKLFASFERGLAFIRSFLRSL